MKQANLKINFLYRMALDVTNILIPLVVTPYISRVLGADGVGISSYVASIVTYFTLLAALGTNSYGTREIARVRDNRKKSSQLFWEIEILSVITSCIALGAWIILCLCSKEYKYYFWAITPNIFATMLDISWFYTGQERIPEIVIKNLICKMVGTIFLFLVINGKEDLVLYILLNSVILAIGNLSMWTRLPQMIFRPYKAIQLKNHLVQTIIYFVPTIAISIYTVLDKTLIGTITKNPYENGYYEQANKIIGMIKTIVFSSVNIVMSARISYLFAEEKFDEIKKHISDSMDYILFVGCGCAFGIVSIANRFIPIFLGPGYESVVLLIYAMAPLVIIVGISNCMGAQYYTPAGKRTQSAKYILVGALVNVICNVFLIRYFSAMGAVWGSIIAEGIITYLYVYNSQNYITWGKIWKMAYKRLIAGAGMMFVVAMAGSVMHNNGIIEIVMLITIGIIIYTIELLIMRDSFLLKIIDDIREKFGEKTK